MTKREYFNLALVQEPQWLKSCLAEPSKAMRPIHLRLIRLALRKMGED